MTGSHTPGPWSAGPEHEYGLGQAVRSDTHVVAYCQTRLAGRHVWHDERRANARLIAAAPDLLSALREAEKALTQVVEGDGGFVVAEPYRQDGLSSKSDRCAHGQFAHQGCATCADVVLDVALEAARAALSKALTPQDEGR